MEQKLVSVQKKLDAMHADHKILREAYDALQARFARTQNDASSSTEAMKSLQTKLQLAEARAETGLYLGSLFCCRYWAID